MPLFSISLVGLNNYLDIVCIGLRLVGVNNYLDIACIGLRLVGLNNYFNNVYSGYVIRLVHFIWTPKKYMEMAEIFFFEIQMMCAKRITYPLLSILYEFSLNSSEAFYGEESISEYVTWFSRENGINREGFWWKHVNTLTWKHVRCFSKGIEQLSWHSFDFLRYYTGATERLPHGEVVKGLFTEASLVSLCNCHKQIIFWYKFILSW